MSDRHAAQASRMHEFPVSVHLSTARVTQGKDIRSQASYPLICDVDLIFFTVERRR